MIRTLFAAVVAAIAIVLGNAPALAQNAYITNAGDDTVSVIATSSNTVTATIPVEVYPYGLAVTPDGSKVYVANHDSSTVSVIGTSNNTVIATIPVGGPIGVAVTPDGSKVYVTNYFSNSVSVIATASNTVTGSPIPVGSGPYAVAVTPDGSKVYVGNGSSTTVSVIATASNTVIATVPVGSSPSGIAVTPDGSKVYVANDISGNVSVIATSSNTVIDTIPVGHNPHGVAVTPDGSKVYVANLDSNTVSAIATSSNTVIAIIPVGSAPWGVAVTPDGSKIYVANANAASNNVSVIATSSDTVTATIPVGQGPIALGVFIQPGAGLVLNWPLPIPYTADAITQGFGVPWPASQPCKTADAGIELHNGIDWNNHPPGGLAGMAVFAAEDGTIVEVLNESSQGFAWNTVLEHTSPTLGKYTTVYWHINPTQYVKKHNPGGTISKGMQIGVIATLPPKIGTHFHFGVRLGGYRQNASGTGALWQQDCPIKNAGFPFPAFPGGFIDPSNPANVVFQ